MTDKDNNLKSKESLYKQEYKDSFIKENIMPTKKILNSQHIKMSIRLGKGVVTSLTIKKNIIALWVLFSPTCSEIEINELKPKKISLLINNFVYASMNTWEKETGKGLSDFITEKMIQEILKFQELYPVYCKLIRDIKI